MVTRSTKKPTRTKNNSRLRHYHAKRDLDASGEPGGPTDRPLPPAAIRRFVIQQHDATRLHYDFRLEMDGVLRSWAVPKGLPTKPGERSLAIEVEDHPLAYGTFEGMIPEGNYGAGAVMLWDRGRYTVATGTAEQSYRRGKIHLALSGEKCVGEWTLVRLRGSGGERKTNWLMIKNRGPVHRAPLTGTARDKSVLTGRTLAEIAGGGRSSRSPQSSRSKARGARRAAAAPRKKKVPARLGGGKNKNPAAALTPAKFIVPMKALSVDTLPPGKWRLEIKLDGYRALAVINQGRVELWSRNHQPLTDDYPEVVAALRKISCANAVIDGEIVALDAQGRSRFQLLQNRGQPGARPPIVYYVFDLLQHDGRSRLAEPLEERQRALAVLVGKASRTLRYSPVFETDPAVLLAAVRQRGLEGIVAKRPGSVYEPGRRSGSWLKVKVHGEQEFVIGGFSAPRNSRTHFGALLVGYRQGADLLYAGKVGTGFDRQRLASLHGEFMKRVRGTCPFVNLPAAKKPRFGAGLTARALREVTWLTPELVAQVRFAEWTEEGLLRQPVFLGLRRDKPAREVVREAAPI